MLKVALENTIVFNMYIILTKVEMQIICYDKRKQKLYNRGQLTTKLYFHLQKNLNKA